jgi:hypothetical protein
MKTLNTIILNKFNILSLQEIYIAHCVYILHYPALITEDCPSIKEKSIVENFKAITAIGPLFRRHKNSWPKDILDVFVVCFRKHFSKKDLNMLTDLDLPFSQFSSALNIGLVYYCPTLAEKLLSFLGQKSLPPLSQEQLDESCIFISSENSPSIDGFPALAKILEPKDLDKLFQAWLLRIIKISAFYVKEKSEYDNYPVKEILPMIRMPKLHARLDCLRLETKEFGLSLNTAGWVRAFLEILEPDRAGKLNRFSSDSQKQKNFLAELDKKPQLAAFIMISAITWPSMDNDFRLLLTEKALPYFIVNQSYLFLLTALDILPNSEKNYWAETIKTALSNSKHKFKTYAVKDFLSRLNSPKKPRVTNFDFLGPMLEPPTFFPESGSR